MSVSFNFSSKVALVTGSSSGIGAASALLFSKAGAQVVVTGLENKMIEEISEKCQKESPEGLIPLRVVADLTKENDIEFLVNETITKFGRIDILVNNAGCIDFAGINEDKYMKVFRNVMETNLTSAVMMTHLCVKYLSKTRGNIINISSIAANITFPKMSMYCMSKSAMDIFTKCMAVELGPLGIRVNSINPGCIRTNIAEQFFSTKEEASAYYDFIGSKCPIGRAGHPEEVAQSILYLASNCSAITTGTILIIDGGYVAAGVNNQLEELHKI